MIAVITITKRMSPEGYAVVSHAKLRQAFTTLHLGLEPIGSERSCCSSEGIGTFEYR